MYISVVVFCEFMVIAYAVILAQSCPWVQFLQPNPFHQMTDPTQPNPSQSKNFWPTNQPNPQPITQSNSIQPTTNLRAQGKLFFTVSKSLSGINYLSGCQALLQQSQEAYQVWEFLEMFLTHNPTQPTTKLKNLDPVQPSPTQPNPWVDPSHGQLCSFGVSGYLTIQLYKSPRAVRHPTAVCPTMFVISKRTAVYYVTYCTSLLSLYSSCDCIEQWLCGTEF